MKIIRNLSIKAKLISGFMCITLLIGVTGFFGKFGMTNIQTNAQNIYSNNLQNIDKIHIIKENLLDEISIVQNTLIDKNITKTNESLQIIETIKSENSKYVISYDESVMSDDTKKTYNDFLSSIGKYEILQNNLLDLLKNEKYTEASDKKSELFEARDDMDRRT